MDKGARKGPDLDMSKILALVKRHPLTTFFILAYALSWWAVDSVCTWGYSQIPLRASGRFLLRSSCWL